LKEGRMFADGPKQDILSSARLSALFGARVKLERDGAYYTSFCQPN